jgi:serine/threonine-protein kinase RsbW
MIKELTVSADSSQLNRLTEFALNAALEAGFDQKQSYRIELAVDEACTNVIEHAYEGKRGGQITMKVAIAPQKWLKITLEDQGKAFDPKSIEHYYPENAFNRTKIGGLGVYIMQTIMDEVRFEFKIPHIGNRLTMIKKV